MASAIKKSIEERLGYYDHESYHEENPDRIAVKKLSEGGTIKPSKLSTPHLLDLIAAALRKGAWVVDGSDEWILGSSEADENLLRKITNGQVALEELRGRLSK